MIPPPAHPSFLLHRAWGGLPWVADVILAFGAVQPLPYIARVAQTTPVRTCDSLYLIYADCLFCSMLPQFATLGWLTIGHHGGRC